MDFDLKEVVEQIKTEPVISMSILQRRLGIGFVKASYLLSSLIDNNYVVKNNKGLYVINEDLVGPSPNGLKLIFLDIDGVLNSHSTKDLCVVYRGIEDKKVALLKEIVDKTNAKIILVSSWKETWYKEAKLKDKQDELATYLDNKLASQGLKITDKTDDYDPFQRGEGILEYLRQLKRRDIKVDNFVILDDEIFDYKETKLTNHLIQTSFYKDGLEEKHMKKAIELLL